MNMARQAYQGKSAYDNRYSVNGNTVRKLYAVPERDRRHENDRRVKKELSASTLRNRQKALSMNLGYVIFLAAAIVITATVCIQYLQIQSSITQKTKAIASLESQYTDLKAENDAAMVRLDSSLDLDYIYKVATEELGMIYAGKEQVVLYDSVENGYVKQFSNIP
jgi:cell division protein FtsL